MGFRNLRVRGTSKAVAAVAAAALGIAGCSSGGTSSPDTGSSSSGGSSSHTGDLTIAVSKAITTLNGDSASANQGASTALNLVADSLWQELPSGKLAPSLASSASHSDNGLVWTLHLRDGAKFSNGQPVTSADVKFTYENEMKQPLQGTNYKNITKIETPNSSTVVFTTSSVDAAFLAEAASYAVAIVPKDFGGESATAFWKKPIGSGAFTVASFSPAKGVVLKKNPNYYQAAKIKVNQITLTAVSDTNTAALKLQNGDVNVLDAGIPNSEVDTLKAHSGVSVHEVPNAAANFLVVNAANPPLNNRNVRRAISLALNRSNMVKSALLGKGQAAGSWLGAADLGGFAPSFGKKYDLAQAKSLLASTPYASGFSLDLPFDSSNATYSTLAQVVKSNLAEIGINVKLQAESSNAVSAALTAGKFGLGFAFIEWDGDPSVVLGYYIATKGFGGSDPNVSTVSSKTTDALSTFDQTARMKKYQDIIDGIANDATLIGLVEGNTYMATAGNIADVVTGAGRVFYRYTTFK